MSTRYDLPHMNRTSTFARTLLVWGLPLLGWLLLIVIISFFNKGGCSSDEPPAPLEAPPQEQPAEQPSSPTQPTQPEQAPAQPSQEKPAVPEAQTSSTATAPYDFSGAASRLNLKNESMCDTGILVDPVTRKVLWAKHANKGVAIASMTKMMTMLLAEEAIVDGRITRQTVIPVTDAAYAIGGSQVWLDPKESFPLQELLKAVAIKSANDAAYLVGEYLGGGDISAFVARMNQRARDIGMEHTVFYETHGLGDAQKRNNLASSYDMILLAERLLDYPEAMRMAGTRMDTFRDGKTELRNHNNLVFNRVSGVDGLKTGYTKAAGFCVTFTCKRNGRRLIGCVTGFPRAKDRDAFCRALLDWGYSQK